MTDLDKFNKKLAIIITPKLKQNRGGFLLSQLFLEYVKDNFQVLLEIEVPLFSSWREKVLSYSRGEIINVNKTSESEIIKLISKSDNIEYVFVNHSYYGNIISHIKKIKPKIKVITFFHNVEALFSLESYKTSKNPGTYLGYLLTKKQEKKLVGFSDIIISLNNRDSNNLKKLYNRHADYVIPLAIRDSLIDDIDYKSLDSYNLPKRFALFVGSKFYANIDGLKWFAKNVSPYIQIPLVVLGSGMESLKSMFAKYPNIIIIGFVDDLRPFYSIADFVVSPIFKGSGMKTKTAEALMYCKSIIGTSEAFEGFSISKEVGICCNSASEFISAYNNINLNKINLHSRVLYENYYSVKAFNRALAFALSSL